MIEFLVVSGLGAFAIIFFVALGDEGLQLLMKLRRGEATQADKIKLLTIPSTPIQYVDMLLFDDDGKVAEAAHHILMRRSPAYASQSAKIRYFSLTPTPIQHVDWLPEAMNEHQRREKSSPKVHPVGYDEDGDGWDD